jgi:cellulose synthase operon protein C
MEGEGRSPKPPLSREDIQTARTSAHRAPVESVDLEDVEEVPPSVEDLASVDDLAIEIDLDDRDSVQNLLTMTGEGWSLDEQRDSLKEAAKERVSERSQREAAPPAARPAVAIPTPFDFGGAEGASGSGDSGEADVRETLPRSMPPPLPPPPSLRGDDTGGSLRPPPLPSNRPPKPPPGHGAPGSRRPPPPLPRSDTGGASRPPVAGLPGVSASQAPPATTEGSTLADLLTARATRLEAAEDAVGIARAHVELAIVHEMLGDDTRVIACAEAALKVDADLAPAHAILRRRLHSRTQLVPMLRHLERELAVASSESAAVELLAERARLLEAGDRVEDASEAWELALGRAPNHSAALKGLEVDLIRRAFADGASDDAWEGLVAHLGRLADAYSAQPNLAAWLHVERARFLETRLGRVDAARGAFERALRLDPGVGPVRDAFTLHCAAHHDSARLAALLADEARMETTSARCARLELDAACITHTLLGDEARAIGLLEHAAARAPTTPSVDRRVLDELVRLYEKSAQWPEAARARRARLHFFTDAAAQMYELRMLASIEERLGNLENAIGDIERALSIDESDATLLEDLDRLLTIGGKDDERIALWHGEATRTDDVNKRAKALAKAAQLAEGQGRHDEALRHLRAAWVAAPGDSEVLDQLSRLMSPAPTETFDREVRALIELYAQAAQNARDDGRRVAYLEKVAVLWEELAGDPMRAARTYEEILRVEPGRRGAILGLGRTAGRIGDDRALSRALFDEAKLADDGGDVLALRVRSAQTLARVDPARATALVSDVLQQDPAHIAARTLETRLHEEAGRWELAAQSIRARVDLAVTPREKVALWLSLAQIQDARLRDPKAAVESLKEARKVDPIHPVPPDEIARVLDAAGDARALRVAIEQLAQEAITPLERARHLTYAAEIDELRLDDDISAAQLYARALAETPEDEMIGDRLVRVLMRRVVTTAGGPGPRMFETAAFRDLLAQIAKRSERATSSQQAQSAAFLLASLMVHANHEITRASEILDALSDPKSGDPGHVGALRMLEHVARRGGTAGQIGRVMKMQGEGFTDVRARLGALWELASLEAWRLPTGESVATYTRILELDPTDPSALEAAVRLAIGPARRGDSSARRAAIAALRSLCALAQDEGSRIAVNLRLGLLLETHGNDVTLEREVGQAHLREALERLREVLTIDPLSVTAATTLARLANRLFDTSGAALAAISLAELSVHPRVRAKYLVDAANLLLSDSPDEALGPMGERTERAAQLLEKALDSDPNSTVAATRLSQVRTQQHRGERLIDVFRTALAAATSRDALVLLGSEIARVARDDLGDVGVAIEAMRKVREAAPDHVPSLLTLSELFIAQRAWPEAVLALEDVVARGKETAPRITALFALASVYEKILARPSDAERALRKALDVDEENPRAIRALIHRLAAKQNEPADDGRPHDKVAAKVEIAQLLEQLTRVEDDRHVRCDILLELADIRIGLKDMAQAEKALVEAVAVEPNHPRAFARLSRFFRSPQNPGAGGLDAVSYARALGGVIARAQQLGTQDARWFASLGHVEVEQLNRLRDGVAHLQRAIQIDPNLHESRFQLATAFSRLGAHDDAAKTVMTMISPTATPLAAISAPAAALELLERALNAERRQEEAIVVSELRAIAGELDEGRHAWLRARRLPAFDAHHAPLDRATLIGHVVPPEGRHAYLEIAAAISGIETKLLRADLSEIGVSSRERVGRRSGNPTRALLDRLCRALNLSDIELVITPNVLRTRVLAQDALWIVVPKALTELPEPTQLASIGRALARVALNVPWLEELPPPHIEAMLIAAARAVLPTYGKDDVDVLSLKLVNQYEPNLAKELSRKHRQALEKVIPLLASPQGRILPIDVFIGALARAELRIAYMLTGDVLATIDELRGLDAAFLEATATPGRGSVAAVLDHPFAGDVLRFALTPEATALRRRVGSTWAG